MENKIVKTQSVENIAKLWGLSFASLKINTYKDCFPDERNKTLKSIIRQENDKPAKMVIYAEFAKMALDFNITNNLNEIQLKNLVDDIFEFYQNFTMRDLKFFIQQIKLGVYGKNFNRLDAPLIFGYLQEYENMRLIEIERSNEEYKNVKIDINYDPNLLFQKIAPMFKKVQEQIKPKTEIQLKAENEVALKIANQQATQLRIHKEFCALHRLQGSKEGTMFVKYKGEMLNFEGFYNVVILE